MRTGFPAIRQLTNPKRQLFYHKNLTTARKIGLESNKNLQKKTE
jgi:hypothetical protein